MKGPHEAAGHGDWPLALPLLRTFLPLQIQVRKAAVAYEVCALLLGARVLQTRPSGAFALGSAAPGWA